MIISKTILKMIYFTADPQTPDIPNSDKNNLERS